MVSLLPMSYREFGNFAANLFSPGVYFCRRITTPLRLLEYLRRYNTTGYYELSGSSP